jgi:hypothetical protein
MKKYFLFAAMAISLVSFAQYPTDKGWRSVGGTGRLYIDLDGSDGRNNSFSLSPEMYWFVANSFSIGTDFGLGFGTSKFDLNDSTTQKMQFASGWVTPGFRFFFREPEKKWRPYVFGNAGIVFGSARTKVTGQPDAKSSTNGFRGYAGGGMAWFFSDHAAFDIRMTLVDYTYDTFYYNPDFTIGIQAFFD